MLLTPIIQWPVHGGDNEVWTLEPASDGCVRIVARHSGKAMGVEFASADDGARVIQYTGHGGANQQWLLRAVAPAASAWAERDPQAQHVMYLRQQWCPVRVMRAQR